MNYNIHINQFALITHFPDLDLFDATILTYLQGLLLSPSNKLERIMIDGRIYTWVNIPTIYKRLPLLAKHIKSESKGWLSTRLSKIQNSGLIRKHVDKKTQKLFVCFTEEIDKLIYKDEAETVHGEEPTVHGEEQNRSPRRTNTNTINTNTKLYKEKYKEKYIFFESEEFILIWIEYLKYKKKLTERGKILNLNKLKQLAGEDISLACQIIDQTLERKWSGLFPLSNSPEKQKPDTQFDNVKITSI